jgi:hypothetical protein
MSAAVWLAVGIAAARTRANFEFGDRAPEVEQRILPRAEAVHRRRDLVREQRRELGEAAVPRAPASGTQQRGCLGTCACWRLLRPACWRISGGRMFWFCTSVNESGAEGGVVDADLGNFALHDEEVRVVTFSWTDWESARVRSPGARQPVETALVTARYEDMRTCQRLSSRRIGQEKSMEGKKRALAGDGLLRVVHVPVRSHGAV